MDGSAVYLQPGFVLQHRPYRETSLLLDVFTRDYGVVPILAKGVRKEKSKTAGILLPFNALRLSFTDRRELKVLSHVEYVAGYALEKLALYCGFYANELVQLFVHKHDPHPEIYGCYERCLTALSGGQAIEQALRYFELDLLQEAGYAVDLGVDGVGDQIQVGRRYRFVAEHGIVADSNGRISAETLEKMAARAPLEGLPLIEAKWLMRTMLDCHLQGRSLKSRDVLAKIIKYL